MDGSLARILLVCLPSLPALGALAVGVCPPRATRLARSLGWAFSLGALGAWIGLWWLSKNGSLPVSLEFPWVPELGIGFHLGLDAVGFWFSGLIVMVGGAAMIGTLPGLPDLNRSHLVCLLLAECGMLGAVASWDLILFIAFWEVTLVPFFLLMGRGPELRGVAAATRFFVTSIASSVVLWVGVLLLVRAAGEPRTFDLGELSRRFEAAPAGGLAWFFVPAFVMRLAVFPLHTWFPVAQSDSPVAASVMLAGGVLPLGGFGVYHLLHRIFGAQLGGTAHALAWLGLGTTLLGGLVALVQRDLKRLLACLCLGQTGLALLGLSLGSPAAVWGGLVLLASAGLSGAAAFLFAGVVCQARDSQRVVDISGLWRRQPLFSGLFLPAVASLGALPGTVGFSGAWPVLRELQGEGLMLVLAAFALLVLGGAGLWTSRRLSGGVFQADLWNSSRWPRRRQVVVLLLLAGVILAVGLWTALDQAAPDPAAAAASMGLGRSP
ncbi:MAG: hypothetical protein GYA21_16290 [Myxococcales bacterium]|nr:hypothetical protein [Myxococcales bacterium]